MGLSFEVEVSQVAHNLAASMLLLLDEMCGNEVGPARLAKTAGIDKGSASRLLSAIRARDPLAVAFRVPGPEVLERVIRVAVATGVATGVVSRARQAVAELEAIINRFPGGRTTFNGIVSSYLPEAKTRLYASTKQTLYRGYSQLKGYSVDVDFTTIFMQPQASSEYVEYTVVSGVLGLRRLRPDAVIQLSAHVIGDNNLGWRCTTLEGLPIDDINAARLDDFCSSHPAEVAATQIGTATVTTVLEHNTSLTAPVDLVLGHRHRLPAPKQDSGRLSGAGVEVDKPIRLLQFDMFVHTDLYRGLHPEAILVDTAFRGLVNLNDPSRLRDRIETIDTVEHLGRGFARARASHIGRYTDLLRHVCSYTGCCEADFRGFRLLLNYPIYGTQATLAFRQP